MNKYVMVVVQSPQGSLMQFSDTDLKRLQENLAKDLVSLEENESVSEEKKNLINEEYAKVYRIISSIIKGSL